MITLSPVYLTGVKADLAKSTVRLTIDIMLTPEVLDYQEEIASFANNNTSLVLTLMRKDGQMSLFSKLQRVSLSRGSGSVQPNRGDTEDMAVLSQRTAAADHDDEDEGEQ